MVFIYLNMIVRNESAIIKRCLESLDWVDGFFIVDTGSTDDTVDIIHQWAESENKPGKIQIEEWRDFGWNRTSAIQKAQAYLKETFGNQRLREVFLLFLDADMLFEEGRNLKKEELDKADVWDIPQENRILRFMNTRLARASLDIRVIGPTHEYYSFPGCQRDKNETVCILDIGDGGSKSDKTSRDIRLLTDAIKDEPDNTRHFFYLANTLKDAERFQEAIQTYETRIEKKGWYEELYCSFLYKGDCHKRMKEKEKAVCEWMNAFNTDPFRLEAICRLVALFRKDSCHHVAMLFLEKGLEALIQKESHPRMLFVEKACYDYVLDYEMSICGYYTGNKERGKKACERLIKNASVPEWIRESCRENYFFYVVDNNEKSGNDC